MSSSSERDRCSIRNGRHVGTELCARDRRADRSWGYMVANKSAH